METPKHRKQMNMLIEQLELAWSDREDFFVGGNMFLYFSEVQTKRNDFRGPDFFVVLHTTQRERKSWVVWQENGQTPDVVIELLSDSTRAVDFGSKKETYAHLLKVRDYFLFDPATAELYGFTWSKESRDYAPLSPNEEGRLHCAALELELGIIDGDFQGVSGPWLRWHDEAGNVLPIGVELADAERERADRQQERADRQQERMAELEAQLAAYKSRFGAIE